MLKSKGVRMLLGASIPAMGLGLCGSAWAQVEAVAQQRDFEFKLPSQALDQALRTVARVSGAQIIFDREATASIIVKPLVGRYTAEQALDRLIAGTSLTLVRNSGGVYAIRPARFAPTSGDNPNTVPAAGDGAQDAAPTQAAQENAPASDAIVVTGIRQSLASAQAVKRDSDAIVDSIVAEDIDKLPDVTVAESIANITGVQVDRAQGEASGVRLRGLADTATTYNGLEIFTGKGRSVALQDFPSGSIRRLDVYKSATADLVEPGIAGLVNIRAQRPLDFKKDQFFGSITGDHWYQSQGLGYDASLLVSKRFDTSIGQIGILISGSYTQNKYIDAVRVNNLTLAHRTNLAAFPGGIYYPTTVNTNYDAADRWRPSGTFVLQWKPSSALEFYIDGLYQGYRSKGRNAQFKAQAGAGATISNIELFPGTDMVKSMDATVAALPAGSVQSIQGSTDTYMLDGGFNWRSGRLKLSGVFAYNESRFESRNFLLDFSLRTMPKLHFDYDADAGVGGGTVVVSNYDLTNAANYRLVDITDGGQIATGNEVQGRLDGEYAINGGFLDKLQFGVMFSDHKAQSYAYNQKGNAPTTAYYTTLPLDYVTTPPGFRNDEAESLRVFLVPTRDSVLDNRDELRALTGLSLPTYGDPTYDSDEKTYSAYAQARYAFKLGVPIDGVFGVRAVRTEDSISGTSRDTQADPAHPGSSIVVVEPIVRRNDYTDFLPNVSTRIHLSRRLQARMAFTMTRTRPTFDNLNPTMTVGLPPTTCATDPDCVRAASAGNIDLQPTRSTNYDFSLEYYPARATSLTAGLFRKDVKGFVSNVSVNVTDPEFGALQLTRPENGGKGHIQGVEAAASTFLTASWLPRWLQKFGVQANVTYLDHSSELAPTLANTLPGQQPIAGVSKWLYNIAGMYETGALSVRLSYNYRSKSVVEYDRLSDTLVVPMSQNGMGWLSLSATVRPTKNVAVTFSATNLLGAYQQNWRPFTASGETYIYQTRFLESVYRLGVRFRF